MMDSDEDDEFSFCATDDVQRNIVYQGGKLNDILAAVDTKIPSLDFDDDLELQEENEGITQFSAQRHGDKLLCENFVPVPSDQDASLFTEEQTVTVSQEVLQTDNTYTKETNPDEISQTFEPDSPKNNVSSKEDNIGDKSFQLDFNKLNEINFHTVASTLYKFCPSERSSSAYDMLCTDSNEEKPEYSNEADLMIKLSNLSKDQLSTCHGIMQESTQEKHVLDYGRVAKFTYLPNQQRDHLYCDSISTKTIHSWTQLKNDNTSQQPRTVFLDLRPEMSAEDQMILKKHTSSIQRILGLKEQRSASNSIDESDDELADWHEMRNKHKEMVFKEKERYEKSFERDWDTAEKLSSVPRINFDSKCEQRKSSPVEELLQQELIGGIVDNDERDESVHSSELAETFMRSKYDSQVRGDDISSFRTTSIPLITSKHHVHERSTDRPCERGSTSQENEMVNKPVATENLKKQHDENSYGSLKMKHMTHRNKRLSNASKKENDDEQEKQDVSETLTVVCVLQENAKDRLRQVDSQKCTPERKDDRSEHEKHLTKGKETSSHTVRDRCTKLLSGGMVTQALAREPLACKDELNAQQSDRELFDWQTWTSSEKTGFTKRKDDNEEAISKINKSVFGRKDCEESIDHKQTRVDVNETKDINSARSLYLRSQPKPRTSKQQKELKEKMRVKIESMRLTVSANGKYPAAYNTPIIYDQEASYEPECHCLLPTVEDQLSLLLIVTLLGCGEINGQRSKGKVPGKSVEVNCYFALVAWLLSLDGAYNSDSGVPFSITAMQQTYQNGKLQLFVGVQPNKAGFDVNTQSGKDSRKNKIKAFNKAISKYLSTHSLRSVYQKIPKVYLSGNFPIDENLYSSKMLSTYIQVGMDPNAVQRVFGAKPGFFWETVEVVDTNEVFKGCDCRNYSAENTIVLVQPSLYHRPSCILDLLSRIETKGCDLAGLRLAYAETYHANNATVFLTHGDHEIVQSSEYLGPRHTLALAVRGPSAICKMKDIIGSKIPILDEPRDVRSLRSLYCSTLCEDKLFYCPSYCNQAAVNLARWFGGRLSEHDVASSEQAECKVNLKSNSLLSDGVPVQKPPSLLVASTQTAFFLINSPLVPPSFLGHVLHICNVRGFSINGIRRMHLNKRQGNNLGLSQFQRAAFFPLSGNSRCQSPNESPPGSPTREKATFNFECTMISSRLDQTYPSTVVVLQKENGLYHATTLVKRLSETFEEWNKSNLSHFEVDPWRLYFFTVQFNEANYKLLCGDVCHSPDASMLTHARCHCFRSNPEIEQVCIVCAVTEEAVQYMGTILKILYSKENCIGGFWELLAIKSFPSLNLIQAKEVTPYEVGERLWESSVKRLMSATVFACVLRGVNIIHRCREFMACLKKMPCAQDRVPDNIHLNWFISQTTEVAFRQLIVLFEEKDLFSDESSRPNLTYVPLLRQKILRNCTDNESKAIRPKNQRKWRQKTKEWKDNTTDDSSTNTDTIQFIELPVMQSLLVGPRPLTTVALVKPSCLLNTKNLAKIFKSICQENFGIVGLRMSVLTRNEAEVLVHDDKANVNKNINYLTSGASLLMCLQRENAVKKFLDILGPKDPIVSRDLDPFLLRGCYGVDSIHNAMHGSETYCAALYEMRMLFPCGLCCDQTIDLEADQIPCRAYDETIGRNRERKLTKRPTDSTGVAAGLASSLVQINCLVMTHHIVYGRDGRQRIALVDVLECLLSLNFIPVGMKMALLSEQQTDDCLSLISSKSPIRRKQKNELTEGPCIVIALQRDNAVTCFDTIIESAQAKYKSFGDYREHILQASTEEEARKLLLCFFDCLLPDCVEEICAV